MPKQAPSFVCKSPKPFPALCSGKYKPHCVVWSLFPSLTLSPAFKLWWRTASSCNYQMLRFIWSKCFPSADSPLSFISSVCCQVCASCAKKTTFLQVFRFSLLFKADEKLKDGHTDITVNLRSAYMLTNYKKKKKGQASWKTGKISYLEYFIVGVCVLIFKESY